MIDFGEFSPLSFASPSVVTSVQYVIFIKNTPGSSVNELRHRMFTKNNLSEDHLPSTLDTLVLHLNRALTYINQRLFNILFELFFFIYQEYQI